MSTRVCLRKILYISALIIITYLCVFIVECECKNEQTEGTLNVAIGENLTVNCFTSNKNTTWKFKDEILKFDAYSSRLSTSVEKNDNNTNEISESQEQYQVKLFINNIKISDEGLYTCESLESEVLKKIIIQPFVEPQIKNVNGIKVKQKIGNPVKFFCVIEVYPQNETLKKQFKWLKDENTFDFLDQLANIVKINTTFVNYTLELTEVYKKENGSYACVIYESNGNERARKNIALLVMDVPKVNIEYVKAVGADKIYLNWTVNDGNDAIQKYFIQYLQEGNPELTYYKDVIGGGNTSYVLENFSPNTSYILRISAKNSIGDGTPFQHPFPVRTLEKDPIFIPKVKTTGSTASTITIGWDPPPTELIPFVQYYELVVVEAADVPKIVEETIYQQNSRNLPYMFDNLKTATEYEFKVRACCDLTKLCGPWSDIVNGTTMDGIASKPTSLQVLCINHDDSNTNVVDINWRHPEKPNGKVISYQIQLEGVASYKHNGKIHNETWGPKIRRIDEPNHHTTYDGVIPNTNYTVTVSAITRHRKSGESATAKCTMPVSVPEFINRVLWKKLLINSEQIVLKAFIPRVSERNGPICCYRLYLIRMKNKDAELPPPSKLNVSSYHEVHAQNNTVGGVYLAEMFSGNNFKSEIFLGDGKRYFEHDGLRADDMDKECHQCLNANGKLYTQKNKVNFPSINAGARNLTELNTNDGSQPENVSLILDMKNKEDLKIWSIDGDSIASTTESFERILPKNTYEVFDGEIDMSSNYTGYLEVIVRNGSSLLRAYSSYFEVITPGISSEQLFIEDEVAVVLNIVILFLAILIGIVLVFLLILCFVYRVNTKNTGSAEEVISLRDSLSRVLFGGRANSHRHFIGTTNGKVTDIGPIHKTDLYMAYKNRHKDTDYGFLREYEMLPNRFSDRTTKNSDFKENSPKNRYPDIKAYDQTRVKLSQINGIHGSDYINANFVIGYKERKKFICAQGPMDATITDFWRMIWEQHLEIIVMLTNLEEYNKTKCAKYWPEKIMDLKQYGDITVKFVAEKKNGDYLIRSLDIFKRNSVNEDEEESRQITQYHYLVWKDFMAPEHPQALIKFIRHINSVYSVQRGPILVHCSAGVGRTGTLVALDSLLQQLEEEGQVSIFNTVCDLRHQRNFLVQSLKQYIFLYRALLDTAHLGNTEINAIGLSNTVEHYKSKTDDGREKCKLEIEFEKLQTISDETNKSCSVGSNEHNSLKNRSELVIPYDRNRVILSPLPHKENSTYINASFIEGYDSLDNFIITQDPLDNTIEDFWRMVSEQSITTIVMLSELSNILDDLDDTNFVCQSQNENKKRVRKLKEKWTSEQTASLIQEVEAREGTWNFLSKEYRDRNLREALWQEVADILKIPRSEVATKWNSLRCSFRAMFNKMGQTKSGQAAGKTTPTNPLYNSLKFLEPTLQIEAPTTSNFPNIGDGTRRCPRYWADDEIQFEHILVKYMQSESCPYYTRREFNVTNCKINDTIKVTQFQYNGWPTVEGEVPEVCRGIIELVDQALSHHSKEKNVGCKSPLTVHCSLGTDRSSIFVAMCILVQQLRTERSVDICTTTRKIRSQRPRLIDTYAQYEFLYRAIVNYADLHKLSE